MDCPQTIELGHNGQISTHVFLIKYSTVLSADKYFKMSYLFVKKICLSDNDFTARIMVFSENVLGSNFSNNLIGL